MTAFAPWQSILGGLGWVLAILYKFTHNYGVAIILLTVGIRLVLLPLGVKQIRSMQATQALQPKMKALQTKYKGDRQRLNEEMMKLYKEHGYNPLSGCLPLLLQLPVLISLFAVLRYPVGISHIPNPQPPGPPNTDLRVAITSKPPHTYFLGASLVCSAVEAGKIVNVTVPGTNGGKASTATKDCGHGVPARIPYYVLAVLMVGTTFFQQRQMTRASPGGAVNSQQQTIMKVMPLLFGIWGFIFPAGLVVYWTTTNTIQIGQQWFLLHRKGAPFAPSAIDGDGHGPVTKGGKGGAKPTPSKPSTMRGSSSGSPRSSSTETPRAGNAPRRPTGGVVPRRNGGGGRPTGSQGGSGGAGGSNGGRGDQRRQQGGGGGGNAGSGKKRPKR